MGSRKSGFIISMVSMLLLSACGSKSFDSKEELLAYIKDGDNGYHFQKSINGIDYSLTYKPTDLMVSQFIGNDHQTNEVDKLRKTYADYLYFNLSMSANGKELLIQKVRNRAEFGAKVNQLAFGMSEKMILVSQDKDTLPLQDYVYPRTYGMGASTEMLLVFENKSNTLQDYLLLSISDLGFDTGEVSFKIDTEKIKNQPTLKF